MSLTLLDGDKLSVPLAVARWHCVYFTVASWWGPSQGFSRRLSWEMNLILQLSRKRGERDQAHIWLLSVVNPLRSTALLQGIPTEGGHDCIETER